MRAKTLSLLLGAIALSGCDAATQIAGEAVQGEIRNAVSNQCQQVAEGAGIVAGRVAAVCECTVATIVADKAITLDDIVPSRIEGVVNQCAVQTGGTTSPPAQQAPTE